MKFKALSCVLVLLFVSSAVSAQSRNEVEISVLFDGEPTFTDTDSSVNSDNPSGTAPEDHVPGEDAGANNLVIRTYDQFGVRGDMPWQSLVILARRCII